MSEITRIISEFLAWWSWVLEPYVWASAVGVIVVSVVIWVLTRIRHQRYWSVPQYRRQG